MRGAYYRQYLKWNLINRRKGSKLEPVSRQELLSLTRKVALMMGQDK